MIRQKRIRLITDVGDDLLHHAITEGSGSETALSTCTGRISDNPSLIKDGGSLNAGKKISVRHQAMSVSQRLEPTNLSSLMLLRLIQTEFLKRMNT